MKNSQVTIINRLGLHARAASKFVSAAKAFSCKITLCKNSEEVDGKSIMSVMLLAASRGTVLTLITDGDDEEAAFDCLESLIAARFDEPD